MKFSLLEYALPPLLPYAVSGLLTLGLSVGGVIKYTIILKRKCDRIVRYIDIASILLLISTAFLVSSIYYWGAALDTSDRMIGTGTVEGSRPVVSIAVFYNATDHRFSHPSWVKIDGTEYYILTDKGLQTGKEINFFYCTDGRMILEWVPSTETLVNVLAQNEKEPPAAHNDTPRNNGAGLPDKWLIIVYVLIFAVIALFQKGIEEKRIKLLQEEDTGSYGTVAPRDISAANSPLQLLVMVLAILSCLGNSPALQIMTISATILFWGLRLLDKWTYIYYEGDEFQYIAFNSKCIIKCSEVVSCKFKEVRGVNRFQLEIVLNTGKKFSLTQNHFIGLMQFKKWLEGNTDTGNLER